MLQQKDAEKSRLADELQNRQNQKKESLQEKENHALVQEKRLVAFTKECGRQMVDIQQDGARRVAQARNEKEAKEKTLDNLISNHPKQQDEWAKELEDLKADNSEEIVLAETKVRSMIENKKSLWEGASAKLFHLRQETANIEKQLDDARKSKF